MCEVCVGCEGCGRGSPSVRMDAGMVYDHLNGQSIVDIHEKGVGIVTVQSTQVHRGNALYEASVITILTAKRWLLTQHMVLSTHLTAS